MKILFVSQLFDPEYSIKGLALMKNWVKKGYEVEVVTTFPNYPSGKVFPDYKMSLKHVEVIDGVKIVRLWSYISHSKSKFSRAFSYLSFTFMALVYSLLCKKPDVLYAYHPQSTTGFIGVLLKKFKKVPFITDVQDLWPDALIATGMKKNGVLVRVIDYWCNYVYKQAKGIVVLSSGFKQALVDRGVESDNIHLIYNWCPEEKQIDEVLISGTHSDKHKMPVSLMYAGNVGIAQSLESLIDAVGGLCPSVINLKIYGNGVEKQLLEARIDKYGYQNIEFMGYLPSTEIFNALANADILAVHLKDEDLFKITIPSKTQSSMAMNKPILMAVGGEANSIVKKANAGVTALPGSVHSIKRAIEDFLVRSDEWGIMGDNARKFYIENFSASANYQKIENLLLEVVRED